MEHLGNQRRTHEEIKRKQLHDFRKLVAFANTHSPYYRNVVKASGINLETCVPGDFPVLTKSDVSANFDDMVTDRALSRDRITAFLKVSKDPFELIDNRYYVLHTSGSSGEVGYFVYSKKDFARGMAQGLRLASPQLKRRKVGFFAAAGGHFTGATMASCLNGPFLKYLYQSTLYDINSPLDTILDKLNKNKPDLLIGYPSALKILAENQRAGKLRIAPSALQCSGEPVGSNDRAYIESTFNAPLTNVYASTEHLYMGVSNSSIHDMYLFEDNLIFEFNDDHTCITNTFNYTLPLIRYRMSDIMVPVEDRDHQYPFTKVSESFGRSEMVPVFTNSNGVDDFISWGVVVEFLVENVKQFQMEVVDKTSFIFKFVPQSGLNETERSVMMKAIRDEWDEILAGKNLANVSYEIHEVSELKVDPKTGKFKLIVLPA